MNPYLKDFILENLLTIKGTFNNRTASEKWWTIRNHTSIYNEILEISKFLPTDSSITRRAYHIVNNLYKVECCIHCKINDKIFINYTDGYSNFCSRQCSSKSDSRTIKIKETNLIRYGVTCSAQNPFIQEKIKEKCLEIHGVEYSTQTESMKSKTKQTKTELYGNGNYNNYTKLKATNLKKYGVEYTGQRIDVIEKIQETRKISLPELRDKDWLIEQNKTKNISKIAEELGITPRSVWLWMIKHNIDFLTHQTKDFREQSEIFKFISEELNISNIKYNDRKAIKPKEIDVYLPEFNLGIELNGMYHHQENKTRHLEKLNLCKERGIKLLQFWDYEWLFKQEICKSIIKSNLGLNKRIFARKCSIVELTSKEYRKFMDENHLQGYTGASIKFGLKFEDEIVSCISFGKPRGKYNKLKYDWELIRYANKLNTNVIGGFSRLFKHCNLDNIISYCDLMKFTGKMYKLVGFTQLKSSSPGFSYFKGYNIKSRETFQKHKLESILKTVDSSLSTEENIWNVGWRKIYNCGNGVWIYKN